MQKPPFEDCTLFKTTTEGNRIWISKEEATDMATFKEIMKQLDITLDKEDRHGRNTQANFRRE